MKIYGLVVVLFFLHSCNRSKDRANDPENSISAAAGNTEVQVSETVLEFGDYFPLVGQSQQIAVTLSLTTGWNEISLGELPDYLSLNGETFPGQGGLCIPHEPLCKIVFIFAPRTVMREEVTFVVNTDLGNFEGKVKVESRLLLGQEKYGPPTVMDQIYSINSDTVIIGSKFVLTDSLHNRVLIWNSIPTAAQEKPDVVLGQPDMFQILGNNGGLSASSLFYPQGLASDGTKLIVADSGNNRVLIWDQVPTQNFAPADLVLGQDDFTSLRPYELSAKYFAPRFGISTHSGKLFITDPVFHRVLGWSTFPTVNGQDPDIVVGQSTLSGTAMNGDGTTVANRSGTNNPHDVVYDGTKLYVSDSSNHRVMIWDPAPTNSEPGKNADFILGQINETHRFPNSNGTAASTPSASSLSYPFTMAHDGSTLWVNDRSNNRILGFPINSSTDPLSEFKADATIVLGQANFTSGAANAGGSTGPSGFDYVWNLSATASADKLVVSDGNNLRFLFWNSIPSASNTPANFALGQVSLTAKNTTLISPNGKSLIKPESISVAGDRVFVADTANHRLLSWSFTDLTNADPLFVLGQSGFSANAANRGLSPARNSFYQPTVVNPLGDGLAVTDRYNNRLLIWNDIPTTGSDDPDLVIGEADFTSATIGATQTNIWEPGSSCTAEGKLLVADRRSSRVLVWNTMPSANGAAANVVIGQTSFTGATANSGGRSASSLQQPAGVACYGSKILVLDSGNSRVLIWNSVPTTNFAPADIVLGQPDFTTGATNSTGLNAKSFSLPNGISIDEKGRLFIADTYNNRILVWNTIPTANSVAADHVIGQANFTSKEAGYEENQLQLPGGVFATRNVVFIADTGNSRVKAVYFGTAPE